MRRWGSPRQAAREFGWNENTYKSHEQGIRGSEGLKVAHIKRYARAFKVSEAWLSTGVGDPFKPDLTSEELEVLRKAVRAITEN